MLSMATINCHGEVLSALGDFVRGAYGLGNVMTGGVPGAFLSYKLHTHNVYIQPVYINYSLHT